MEDKSELRTIALQAALGLATRNNSESVKTAESVVADAKSMHGFLVGESKGDDQVQ